MAWLCFCDSLKRFDLGSFHLCTMGINFVTWEPFMGMVYIIHERHYDVGDFIQVCPHRIITRTSLKRENAWRVQKITLFHTEIVSLASGARTRWANGRIRYMGFHNWSNLPLPAQFTIIVQILVGTCNGDGRLLGQIHKKVEQYVRDNPLEWSAVNIPTASGFTSGNEDKEYRMEIYHCRTYKELDVVFDSHDKLSVYLQDLMQAGRLSNKKPAKGSGSMLSMAAGDNDQGGETDNDKLKIDQTEAERKMDEEDEQKQGDVEEGGNAENGDYCIKYRIFIR